MATINLSGITTGLLEFQLKKEFLGGDGIFFRETQVFNYDIFSVNVTGSGNVFSPLQIQENIYQQFSTLYSGNILVKVFEQPADYFFPDDSMRAARYNVQVEVLQEPVSVGGSQPELLTSYYEGIDPTFFNTYYSYLTDLKEEFSFSQEDNGNQLFNHNLSFGLISGDKSTAQSLAQYIFAADSSTTFGISAMVGGCIVANTGIFQDYFTETYDVFRNVFSFTKRREILPDSGINYTYNLTHLFDLKDDGTIDMSEKGNVKGFISFDQVQNGINTLLTGSYNRCNLVYQTYTGYLGNAGTIIYPLINAPLKTTKMYNQQAILGDYEVSYTNSPEFYANSTRIEEIIDMHVDIMNIVDITHNFNVEVNRRNMPAGGIISIITGITNSSPTTVSNYYANGGYYYKPWLINQIKRNINWPYQKPKGSITLEYTTNPKKFSVINGTKFNYLNVRVNNTLPEDIWNEYKVINRPNQLSVLNYAYQTDKGTINISMEAGLGRNPNEFALGFRNNIGTPLTVLYLYGVSVFMQQFSTINTVALSYYLENLKYSINNDGILQISMDCPYWIKKYLI